MKNVLRKGLLFAAAACLPVLALATPSNFVTTNNTSVESNVVINGITSPYPTKPDGKPNPVPWSKVELVCFYTSPCIATMTMAGKSIGTASIDLKTGKICLNGKCGDGTTYTNDGYTVKVTSAPDAPNASVVINPAS